MTTAQKIAVALGDACRSGPRWRCRCPVHDSSGPTLALLDGDRGLAVKCFAGCDSRDILAELCRRGLLGGTGNRYRTPWATLRPPERDDTARRIAVARRIGMPLTTRAEARWRPISLAAALPSTRRHRCAGRPRCAAGMVQMGRR